MARQLAFDLPRHPAQGAADFFVSPANEPAFRLVLGWRDWPLGKLALSGPADSGKTHLAKVWAEDADALLIPARDLLPDAPLPPAGSRLGIEDLESLPEAAEEYLFHLHNHLAATSGRLLVTGRAAPSAWPVRLPDLASRLQGAAHARLGDPDDALLAAVLAKHFADRQIAPPPDLVPWLAARIERSFAAAAEIVERLDAAALEQRRRIGVPLARSLLDSPDTGLIIEP